MSYILFFVSLLEPVCFWTPYTFTFWLFGNEHSSEHFLLCSTEWKSYRFWNDMKVSKWWQEVFIFGCMLNDTHLCSLFGCVYSAAPERQTVLAGRTVSVWPHNQHNQVTMATSISCDISWDEVIWLVIECTCHHMHTHSRTETLTSRKRIQFKIGTPDILKDKQLKTQINNWAHRLHRRAWTFSICFINFFKARHKTMAQDVCLCTL